MKRKRHLSKLFTLAVLVLALVVTAACRNEDETEEAESTMEAEVEAVMEPTPTAAPPEPTAEQATAAPTEEAISAPEPTPSPAPVLEEYVSVTDFFSVQVPAGWSSEESFPGGAFVMANSEAALGRFHNGNAIESGDLVLNIGFLPYQLFRQREVVPLGIQFDATPDIFLQSLLPMFRFADTTAVSEPELVALSDARDAALLSVADAGREGLVLMFIAGDEVVAFVSAVGFPGELDAFQDITYAVAAEAVFSGAQEALYGTLLGG